MVRRDMSREEELQALNDAVQRRKVIQFILCDEGEDQVEETEDLLLFKTSYSPRERRGWVVLGSTQLSLIPRDEKWLMSAVPGLWFEAAEISFQDTRGLRDVQYRKLDGDRGGMFV